MVLLLIERRFNICGGEWFKRRIWRPSRKRRRKRWRSMRCWRRWGLKSQNKKHKQIITRIQNKLFCMTNTVVTGTINPFRKTNKNCTTWTIIIISQTTASGVQAKIPISWCYFSPIKNVDSCPKITLFLITRNDIIIKVICYLICMVFY